MRALLLQLLMNHKAWVTYIRTRIRLFLDRKAVRAERGDGGRGRIRGLWPDAAEKGSEGQD